MIDQKIGKKEERFCDLLENVDTSSVEALLLLSEQTWELGSVSEIKKLLSNEAFTIHIVSNIIANWKGDGWCNIIEEHSEILQHIPDSMKEIGLIDVGEAVEDLYVIFTRFLDHSSSKEEYEDLINFLRNLQYESKNPLLVPVHAVDREALHKEYVTKLEILEELVEDLWGCGAANNGGWGIVTSYLNNHLDCRVWSIE